MFYVHGSHFASAKDTMKHCQNHGVISQADFRSCRKQLGCLRRREHDKDPVFCPDGLGGSDELSVSWIGVNHFQGLQPGKKTPDCGDAPPNGCSLRTRRFKLSDMLIYCYEGYFSRIVKRNVLMAKKGDEVATVGAPGC
jgi:hypothetical protein